MSLDPFESSNTLFITDEDPEVKKLEEHIRTLLEQVKQSKRKAQEKKNSNRISLFREIGEYAEKANIHLLDREILLGAFLEIRRIVDSRQTEKIKEWRAATQKKDMQYEEGEGS